MSWNGNWGTARLRIAVIDGSMKRDVHRNDRVRAGLLYLTASVSRFDIRQRGYGTASSFKLTFGGSRCLGWLETLREDM